MNNSLRLCCIVLTALTANCATTERLAAAGDVRALLVAIRDDDRVSFDAHVDRIALEAQLRAHLVDRAGSANLPNAWKGLGVVLSGPLARVAGDTLIQPEVFRAVAEYYGYRAGAPIPNSVALAEALRTLPDGRVCVARGRKSSCLLTFADEAGVWRLVGFDANASMLHLKSR